MIKYNEEINQEKMAEHQKHVKTIQELMSTVAKRDKELAIFR